MIGLVIWKFPTKKRSSGPGGFPSDFNQIFIE